MLRWTHEAIAAYGASTYVTMCFVFVDVDERGTRLSIALGGHPRPLLWRNGTIRPVGECGTLLGMVEPKLATTVEELRPGDVLMLYTDGLTDTSDAPLDEAGLAELLSDTLATCEPQTCADAIHAELHRRRPLGSSDDSAVLLVHASDPAEAVEPAADAVAWAPRPIEPETRATRMMNAGLG